MKDQVVYKNNPKRTLIIAGIGVGITAISLLRGIQWDYDYYRISGTYIALPSSGLA